MQCSELHNKCSLESESYIELISAVLNESAKLWTRSFIYGYFMSNSARCIKADVFSYRM